MGKHFETAVAIGEGFFRWQRRTVAVEAEAALDGIYVIRSSEKNKADLPAAAGSAARRGERHSNNGPFDAAPKAGLGAVGPVARKANLRDRLSSVESTTYCGGTSG